MRGAAPVPAHVTQRAGGVQTRLHPHIVPEELLASCGRQGQATGEYLAFRGRGQGAT